MTTPLGAVYRPMSAYPHYQIMRDNTTPNPLDFGGFSEEEFAMTAKVLIQSTGLKITMTPILKINLIDFVVWLALKDWELDAEYPIPRESFEYYEYLSHCYSDQLTGSKSERFHTIEKLVKETWLWKIHCIISRPWYRINGKLQDYKIQGFSL